MAKEKLPITRLGYRPAELAKAFDVSEVTIYSWMKLGHLKYARIGASRFITPEEVQRLLSEGVNRAERETAQGKADKVTKARAARREKPAVRRGSKAA